MGIGKVINFAPVGSLWLDPQNPRIGRAKRREKLSQPDLLKLMSVWTIDELIDSFLSAGGFWTQDALIVVRELHDGEERLVVVEGNRRLAALKLMEHSLSDSLDVPIWVTELMNEASIEDNDPLFTEVPYLIADSRKDVENYLGFRHVTGVKEWPPAEKAEFITKLVDDNGLSYKEVAKRIGSRADTVRQYYISFKILQQIESMLDYDEWIEIEEKFSVLLLALRSARVRDFLGVDVTTEFTGHHDPIPEKKKSDLRDFIGWVFGTKQSGPIVKDSRQIDKFAEILIEPRSVEYLRTSPSPTLDKAYSLTKAAVDLVIDPLREAHRQITFALSEIPGRGNEQAVRDEAWPVIEGGIRLAQATNGQNLERAKEMILGA